jgi:hypothetical protein
VVLTQVGAEKRFCLQEIETASRPKTIFNATFQQKDNPAPEGAGSESAVT